MKRFAEISVLAVMAMALSFSVAASEHWRMSTEQPSNNFITKVAEDFARSVKRATYGELEITVVPHSFLVKRDQVKSSVERGEIELGDVLLSALGKEDPLFGLDSVPLLATNYEQARSLWAFARPYIEERLLRDGVRLLYAVPWPPQSLYTSQRLGSMDDFKGMRFRSYNETISRMASLLGAEPTVIPTEDVPDAFRRGLIDAMLTSSATGMDLKAWNFTSHLYDIKAFIPKNAVLLNEAAFQRLSPNAQRSVLRAAQRAEVQGWELSWALTAYQVRMLERHGMKIENTLAPQVKDAFGRIGVTLAEEWIAKTGAVGKQIIDAYRQESIAEAD